MKSKILGCICIVLSVICTYFVTKNFVDKYRGGNSGRYAGGLAALNSPIPCGVVRQGELLERRFDLKNTGAKAIRIGEIRAGCDCTSHEIATETLAPGQSTTLLCKWKTDTKRGPSRTNVIVHYVVDEIDTSDFITVAMTADIIPEFSTHPDRLEFRPDAPTTAVVRIEPGNLRDVEILDAYIPQRGFGVIIRPEKKDILIEFDPSRWLNSNTTTELFIKTNSKIDPVRKLKVSVGK